MANSSTLYVANLKRRIQKSYGCAGRPRPICIRVDEPPESRNVRRKQFRSTFILDEFGLIAAIMINSIGMKWDQLFLTKRLLS